MDKLKLVKFRSLANQKDLDRAINIITTGKFWCTKLWNMNDPMEGVYSTSNRDIIPKMFTEKNKYVICSFSDNSDDNIPKKPIQNPLLWGYYANGFKGIAIEIEEDESNVKKVDYISRTDIDKLIGKGSLDGDIAMEIITKKLKCWNLEHEWRFLKDSNEDSYKIGKIIRVYIGRPYITTENYKEIALNSNTLKNYLEYQETIEKLCDSCGVEVQYANIGKSNKVVFQERDDELIV